MKALTIKQPWSSLVAKGIKDIENRTWRTDFRGRIYIHSSAKAGIYEFNESQMAKIVSLPNVFKGNMDDYIFSAIIGEVDIVDCVLGHHSIWAEHRALVMRKVDGVRKEIEVPVYNWVLANPVLYDKPIPNVKGSLSFWEFDREGEQNG